MQNFSDMLEGSRLLLLNLSSPHIISYLFIKVKSATTPGGSRIGLYFHILEILYYSSGSRVPDRSLNLLQEILYLILIFHHRRLFLQKTLNHLPVVQRYSIYIVFWSNLKSKIRSLTLYIINRSHSLDTNAFYKFY